MDPYVDPTSGLLRNRLGITNRDRLTRAEAELSYAAIADLSINPLPGNYDLDHLCAIHREIFGDVYEWAGQVRTVNIAKTDLFCVHQHIQAYAAETFSALAKENHLRGLPRPIFVDRLTHYFAEVNAIHPFREGNGRAQRAFFSQLCRSAGRPIDWSALDDDRNIAASIASLRGDNVPMQELLAGLVS